jgi:hypothetical protein
MRRFIIRARTRLGHMSGYFHVGDLLWRMFSNGWVQPKKDIRLWFDGPDHLAGFAWYYSKFHAVDLQVFPRNPDLEQEMLIWAETNALSSSNGNGRKHLFTTALETDSDRIALLTEFGYKKQKAFYYHFLRALPSYLPVPELPPGFTIRDVTDKDIAAKVASTVYTADGFSRSPREKEFRDILGGDMVFTVKQLDLAYTPVFDDDAVLTGGEGTTFNGTYRVVEIISDGADVTYRIQLRR